MELNTSESIDPTVNAATDSTADLTLELNDDQADSIPSIRTKVRTPMRSKRSNASKLFFPMLLIVKTSQTLDLPTILASLEV